MLKKGERNSPTPSADRQWDRLVTPTPSLNLFGSRVSGADKELLAFIHEFILDWDSEAGDLHALTPISRRLNEILTLAHTEIFLQRTQVPYIFYHIAFPRTSISPERVYRVLFDVHASFTHNKFVYEIILEGLRPAP